MKSKKDLIKEDFYEFLEKSEIPLEEFKDWYAKNFLKIPVGVLRKLMARMNRIADDERLGPNRRLLATYQSSYWSAKLAGDSTEEALLSAVILGEFVNRNGFKLYDKSEQPQNGAGDGSGQSKLEIAALSNLKEAFSVMKGNLKEEGFLPNDTAAI
jgi:hypothetical protein